MGSARRVPVVRMRAGRSRKYKRGSYRGARGKIFGGQPRLPAEAGADNGSSTPDEKFEGLLPKINPEFARDFCVFRRRRVRVRSACVRYCQLGKGSEVATRRVSGFSGGHRARHRHRGRVREPVPGDKEMSVRVISAILDALAACARTMFEVGLGLVQSNLDAAKARRREREQRRQDGARK